MTKLVQLEPNASISVWAIDLASIHTHDCQHCLSQDERERATRFARTQDRTNYLAAHIALRHLLAHATGTTPKALEFTRGPLGKPMLPLASPCVFNLSHSGSWALVGISQGKAATVIGVDIEELRPLTDLLALAAQVLTQAEQAALESLPTHQHTAAFLGCWTRKEACMKAWGCGLQLEPQELQTGLHSTAQGSTVTHPAQPIPLLVRTHQHSAHFVASVAIT